MVWWRSSLISEGCGKECNEFPMDSQWISKGPGKEFDWIPKDFSRIWIWIEFISKGFEKEIDWFLKDWLKHFIISNRCAIDC